jgi:cytochrome P450
VSGSIGVFELTPQTVAVLSTFFLAMALYPDVQATAQAEIDKVLTKGRMPQLSDRASLPYVECLMREVMRWNPIGPLGFIYVLDGAKSH